MRNCLLSHVPHLRLLGVGGGVVWTNMKYRTIRRWGLCELLRPQYKVGIHASLYCIIQPRINLCDQIRSIFQPTQHVWNLHDACRHNWSQFELSAWHQSPLFLFSFYRSNSLKMEPLCYMKFLVPPVVCLTNLIECLDMFLIASDSERGRG